MTNESEQSDTKRRLIAAEMELERSKVVMDSLAGFCHALGQPATVILSSVELMKLPSTDRETFDEILDICQEAALEIRDLLNQMKARREYISESYLSSGDKKGGDMLSMPEWHDKRRAACRMMNEE